MVSPIKTNAALQKEYKCVQCESRLKIYRVDGIGNICSVSCAKIYLVNLSVLLNIQLQSHKS